MGSILLDGLDFCFQCRPMNPSLLYHCDAYGLPALKVGPISGLSLSRHAKDQAFAKNINLGKVALSTFDPSDWHIVEVEVVGGIPVKLVGRKHYDEQNDLVVAVLRKEKLIKTVWLNRKDDKHATLDKTPYSKPKGVKKV